MGLDFERNLYPPESASEEALRLVILNFLRYIALAVACPADKVFQIYQLVHHPVAIVELDANVL